MSGGVNLAVQDIVIIVAFCAFSPQWSNFSNSGPLLELIFGSPGLCLTLLSPFLSLWVFLILSPPFPLFTFFLSLSTFLIGGGSSSSNNGSCLPPVIHRRYFLFFCLSLLSHSSMPLFLLSIFFLGKFQFGGTLSLCSHFPDYSLPYFLSPYYHFCFLSLSFLSFSSFTLFSFMGSSLLLLGDLWFLVCVFASSLALSGFYLSLFSGVSKLEAPFTLNWSLSFHYYLDTSSSYNSMWVQKVFLKFKFDDWGHISLPPSFLISNFFPHIAIISSFVNSTKYLLYTVPH